MAKAALQMTKKNFFTRKLDLNLREKLVKSYIWSAGFFVLMLKLGHFGN